MNKKIIFIFILTLLYPLKLNSEINKIYSIQVTSSKSLDDCKKTYYYLSKIIDTNIRIEKIGQYYVVRVGMENTIKNLIPFLNKLKSAGYSSAFIRNAYYISNRIVIENYPSLYESKKISISNDKLPELMELLINAYTYAGKINKAEAVAEQAVTLYPYNWKFLKIYGQILLWNSKPEKALDILYRAFKLKKDKDVAKNLFRLSMELKRYDISKQVLPYVNYKWNQILEIYTQLGDIEKLIDLLKKKKTKDSMNTLIYLYFSMGDRENTLKTLKEKERLFGLDENDLLIMANVYYSKRQFNRALNILKNHIKNLTEIQNIEYLETLSDLAWMLQDHETAEIASQRLIQLKSTREVDYVRVSMTKFLKDPKGAFSVCVLGYRRIKSTYLLSRALSIAYSHSMWDEIMNLYRNLNQDEMDKIIQNSSVVFYFSTALEKTGNAKESIQLIENALAKRFSTDLLQNYIYLAISINNPDILKKIIWEYKIHEKNPELISAFAMAYIQLRDGISAMNLIKKIHNPDPIIIADALYILGKEQESRNLRYAAFRKMKNTLNTNPYLIKDPIFMQNYLSISMDFVAFNEYQSLLNKAKEILPKPVYEDIFISYLFAKDRQDKAAYLSQINKYKLQPWMLLSFALNKENRLLQKDVLETYSDLLPSRDRVSALENTFQIKKAINVAYKEFQQRPYDFLIYKQLRDLIVENANSIKLTSTFETRKSFTQVTEKLSLNYKLIDSGFGVGINSFFSQVIDKDEDVFDKTPSGKKLTIFINKLTKRGSFSLGGGYFSRLSNNIHTYFKQDIKVTRRLDFGYGLYVNQESEETEYLNIGGVEDKLEITGSYSLSNTSYLSLLTALSRYYSQDRKYLGMGQNLYLELQKRVRTSYPDFTIRALAQYANYSENKTKGNIKDVSKLTDVKFLPEDFYLIGGGFLFGYEHRDSYTRTWKPFVNIDVGYNSVSNLSIGANLGFGGILFGEDQLSLEIGYSKNTGGVAETLKSITLNYSKWF